MRAIQLVRATTARPSSRTQRTNVVMKYGVGFAAGNLVIAVMIKINGSEAASAGMLRRTCGESEKKRWAVKSETEKNNVPDPAATTRKLARSISAGPIAIQRSAEKNVRTTAAAIASTERRASATPMTTKSRTSRQNQTADEVSFFETQIQIRMSGSSGTKFRTDIFPLSSPVNGGQTAKPAWRIEKTT